MCDHKTLPHFHIIPSAEAADLADELRRLFEDLERGLRGERRMLAGECRPALDVFETEETVEILVDLPGVAASDLRVLVKSGVVLVAGEKTRAPLGEEPAGFHLVERGFGRFARAVRLTGAFDAGRVRATLVRGELRVVLPKIADRRGREVLVPVEQPPAEGEAGGGEGPRR